MLALRLREQPERSLVAVRHSAGRDTFRELAVVGAHGGAGASMLAELLRPAWDLGTVTHRMDLDHTPVRAGGRPLVVVARNTVAAARHATSAVTALHGPQTPIAVLVIIADGAGGEPRDATARFALLDGRVGGIVRIPFVPALRLVDHVSAINLPDKALAAVARIRGLAHPQPGHH